MSYENEFVDKIEPFKFCTAKVDLRSIPQSDQYRILHMELQLTAVYDMSLLA